MFGTMSQRLRILLLGVTVVAAGLIVGTTLYAQKPTPAIPAEVLPSGKPVPSLGNPVLESPVPSTRTLPPTFIAPGGVPGQPVPTPVTIEQPGEGIPYEQSPGILIVPVSPRKIAGYSAEGGGWKHYETPERMQVSPVASEKLVAFVSIASEVSEVVCFSGPRGDFHRHGIARSPGPVEPSVTSCLAWYQIPAGIVAYSAITNSWGDLPIKAIQECEVHHTDSLLTVIADGRLHAFSSKTGRWDSVDLQQR